MKKSFMTRALAMGLSVAMAFSLSAATNVSVASAAAKPAMASKQFAVRVGGAAKSYKASTATQKSFKITKATVGNTDKATVSINSSKKSIKVTPGTVTGTTVVKVTFKNNKTKKSTTKSYRCVVKGEVKQDPAITSAKQTGVKAITVTTNFDAEAAQSKVTVKRGSNDVATDKISFSDDGKTIVINTTANIIAAEYTVNVGDLKETVKGEASKVDKIEILSDKAAAVKVNDHYTSAVVGYKVTNQFGDDITKTTSLVVNSSANHASLSSKDHLINFTSDKEFMINRDIITVTLLDQQTGVNTNANLTVSMEAYAKDITFEGVYNVDKKALTEDTDTDQDDFYLLFTAKDQYGNVFKRYKGIEEGKDLFLSVMGGLTTLEKPANVKKYTVINKEGVDYLAFPIKFQDRTSKGNMWPQAGEVTIQLLSAGGSSCTGTVTVEPGVRATSLTVNAPSVIPALEKTTIDFVATDAAGNEVTAYKVLRHIEINGSTDYPLTFEKNLDGTAKLVLDASAKSLKLNQSSMQTYTFTTQGKQFYHKMLTITEQRRPVSIEGLRDVSTVFSKGANKVTIKLKNLMIQDQYGEIMSNDTLKRIARNSDVDPYPYNGTIDPMYNLSCVEVTLPDLSGVKFKDDLTADKKVVLMDASTTADTTICELVPGNRKGDTIIEFKIHNGNDDVVAKGLNDASEDVRFTVKDTSEVEAATVSVGEIYVGAGTKSAFNPKYEQDIVVKAGGAQLPADDYNVSVPSGLKVRRVNGGDVDVWRIYSTDDADNITEFKNNTATTLKRKIAVTLNGSGEKIETEVTLNKTAPYVKTVSTKSNEYKISASKPDTLDLYDMYFKCIGELKDQYGKALDISTFAAIKYQNGVTFGPIVTVSFKTSDGGKVTIKDNGTGTPSLKAPAGVTFDKATVTISFNGDIADENRVQINLKAVADDKVPGKLYEEFNDIINGELTGQSAVDKINDNEQLRLNTTWGRLKDNDQKLMVVKALQKKATCSSIEACQTTLAEVTNAIVGVEDVFAKFAKTDLAVVATGAPLATKTYTLNAVSTSAIGTATYVVSKAALVTEASISTTASAVVATTGVAISTGSSVINITVNAGDYDDLDAYVDNQVATVPVTFEIKDAGNDVIGAVYVEYKITTKMADATHNYFVVEEVVRNINI